MTQSLADTVTNVLAGISPHRRIGSLISASGTVLRATLPGAAIGDRVEIDRENSLPYSYGAREPLAAEVVAFDGHSLLLSPLGRIEGLAPGARVALSDGRLRIAASEALLGAVVDASGKIIARLSPQAALPMLDSRPLESTRTGWRRAPPPLSRPRITEQFFTGIRAIDGLLPLGIGSRMCVLAEPGVGKTSLIVSLLDAPSADIRVVALVGERGREVSELVERAKARTFAGRTILVVSTSDEPALGRVEAAETAQCIADYFRDRGHSVLLVVDSLTRLGRALREIGLAAGELPVRRGYPPSVFSALPLLVERAGRTAHGAITALYTVLASQDLEEDPLVEEVKGLTDGHLCLSRERAEAGQFPAIDPCRSLSRLAPAVAAPEHMTAAAMVRKAVARLNRDRDLLALGGVPDAELARYLAAENLISAFVEQSIYPADGAHTVELLRELAGTLQGA